MIADVGQPLLRSSLEAALAPYRPETDGPWNRALASHLARRLSFGMPPAEVDRILEEGPQAATTRLLHGQPENDGERLTERTSMRLGSRESIQSAWVYRMLLGADPVREKLALFWHGHFATSDRKVADAQLMAEQISLLRRRGGAPFPELVLAVARDPAMLIWLDGNSNRCGRPNENFARELFELFCLGVGNYTERDIQEAARAFTGWHVRSRRFSFVRALHDAGEKEILGACGAFGGEDVVRLATSAPACARFVARELYEYYVSLRPAPGLVEALGGMYRECGLRTREFLARLVSSRLFYDAAVRRSLVSPPVDFAIGTLRTLGATASPSELVRSIAAMGQELLLPPSVNGWESGFGWLRSTTLLARYRFAEDLAAGRLEARVPWERLGARESLLDLFFPDALDPSVRSAILEGAGDEPKTVLASCMELPEFQFV